VQRVIIYFLVLTHAEEWNKSNIEIFIYDAIDKINDNDLDIRLNRDHVEQACFAKLSEIKEDFLEIYKKEVIKSKENIINLLKIKTSYFEPLSNVVKDLLDENLKINEKIIFHKDENFKINERLKEIDNQKLEILNDKIEINNQKIRIKQSKNRN